MSDDTPTQRFDTPANPGGGDERDDDGKKSRGLLIALIALGAAILIAVIVLLIVLLNGMSKPVATGTTSPTVSETPTTSSTPSATPTPTTTATTAPVPTASGGGGSTQPTGAAFTTFAPVKQVHCSQGTQNFTPPPIAIQLKWATVRTNSVWIVFGDSDAADSGFMQLPISGNQSNFPYELDYPCGTASIEVTMTLVGSDGHHVQKHWTITNTGDKF